MVVCNLKVFTRESFRLYDPPPCIFHTFHSQFVTTKWQSSTWEQASHRGLQMHSILRQFDVQLTQARRERKKEKELT